MKNAWLLTLGLILCPLSAGFAANIQEHTEKIGLFGEIHLYHIDNTPKHLVLFISGDGGWNSGVIEMARQLVQPGVLVVGIDVTHYFGELAKALSQCSYPAAHFESLSQFLQTKYHFSIWSVSLDPMKGKQVFARV